MNEVKVGYKQTEIGIIPEDWEVKRLGEIGESIIGLTYSPSEVADYGKLVHRSSNIQKNQLSYNDNVYVNKIINEKLILKENDILICVRNGSRDLIGKSALIKGKAIGETFGAFMSVFRSDKCQPFIFYSILSNLIQRQINQSLGATINQITNKTLNNFQIPYPPKFEEQTAIATVLSNTDALIERLEKLIAKKKGIKQGAMQELLTGKKRLPGFSGKWEVKKLGEIAEMSSGGTPLTSNNSYYGGQIPWVVIADMTRIKKYLFDTDKNITELGLRNSSAKLFKKGTLLFAMYASIGKCAIAKVDITCNQAILGINTQKIDTEFLYYHLAFNEQKFLQMGQTGTQNNLNKEIVQNLDIPYPSSEEQTAITQILSDMDADIDQLEQKLNKYKMIKQGMMQELLTGKRRLI